jgi:DNA-binding transcriptional regulator YbjK
MSPFLRAFFLGTLALGCAAAAAESPRRYRYMGTIGDKPARLDLTLAGRQVKGSYEQDRLDRPQMIEGTIDEAGRVTLRESDIDERVSVTFRGLLEAAQERFRGEWSSLDGKLKVPFDLTLVADYVVLTSNPGAASHIEVAYPHFVAKRKFGQEVEAMLAGSAQKICADAIDEARDQSDPELLPGYSRHVDFDLKYVSDGLISALVCDYKYAGGAHGMTSFSARNFWLEGGKIKEVELKDFFKPGSAYLKRLSDYAIEDLRRQKASNVVGGTVTMVNADDMQRACITAGGVSLTFGAYEFGCYAEGSFTVLVPWGRIGDLIDPAGPAGRFAGVK